MSQILNDFNTSLSALAEVLEVKPEQIELHIVYGISTENVADKMDDDDEDDLFPVYPTMQATLRHDRSKWWSVSADSLYCTDRTNVMGTMEGSMWGTSITFNAYNQEGTCAQYEITNDLHEQIATHLESLLKVMYDSQELPERMLRTFETA